MMQILAPWTILSYQWFDNSLKNIPEYLTIGFHEPVRAVSNIPLAREWNFNYYCSLFFFNTSGLEVGHSGRRLLQLLKQEYMDDGK